MARALPFQRSMDDMPETIEGLPNISGREDWVRDLARRPGPHYLPESDIRWESARATFANALHMHQPLIPAEGDHLQTARVISNLRWMMERPTLGDNHDAPVFRWCYRRMGEFIPELVGEGKSPRIMLEYSGCLLHGLVEMGAWDVIDALRAITLDAKYRRAVEWLGAPWGHAVAPSTPVLDYALHVRAWQHHFGALFGAEALARVKGFSPAEMALPNHPDVSHAMVRALVDAGFRWLLVQEHTVEPAPGGGSLADPYVPHRLIAKSSRGETAEIIAIIKTQGSDTKLVAQGQPYYEAKGLSRRTLAGKSVPALVTQIADGENGGVMMNEFPAKYLEVMRECSGSETPAVNVTEYLEHLDALGVRMADLPPIQPRYQHRIWQRFDAGLGPRALDPVIRELERSDAQFHMRGGSWTNDRSWVEGYEHVLGPMEEASALFHEKVTQRGASTSEHRYRNALFHLLASQTSCYRYWGEGIWTDWGRELSRRALEIVKHDF